MSYTKVCKTDRMHLPEAEAAGWGILLPLLVKAYAKAVLLPKERGAHAIGTGGRGARRPAPLPEDALQRKGAGSGCYALFAETFFPSFRKTTGITYNPNNSKAAG